MFFLELKELNYYFQKQPMEVFFKKSALGNFAKFTGKHLCQGLLRPATLLKKRLWHSCFPVKFAKLPRTPFLQNTSERLLLYFLRCVNMMSISTKKRLCFSGFQMTIQILWFFQNRQEQWVLLQELQWASRFLSKQGYWTLNNSYIILSCLQKRILSMKIYQEGEKQFLQNFLWWSSMITI